MNRSVENSGHDKPVVLITNQIEFTPRQGFGENVVYTRLIN
jgi:hypothetical protein